MSGLSRREFLLAVGAVGGAGIAAGALAGCGVLGDDADAGSLGAVFSNPETARQLGERAQELPDVGDDPETLAAALAPDRRDPVEFLASGPVEDVRATLAEGTAADWAAGDFVEVAGWLLSPTEARASALVAVWS